LPPCCFPVPAADLLCHRQVLYGLALSYLYRTPPGGEAQGLGPAGLALLGPRGPFPAGPRTLLLYDAAKKPHASVSCGADGLQLLPPAPQSGYATLQVGSGSSADGGAPSTTWSLLLRDPGTEWEPLARAMAMARATSAAHGSASGAGGPPGVVVQDVVLGDGGPRRDDVAALGDVCEVSYTMYAPPVGQAEDGDAHWASPVETHTRALVALTAAQGPHVAPRGMLEGLTGCAAGGRRLFLVPGAAVCAGPELLAVSAHAQGLLMYDVTLHTARAVLPSTQAEEQAGGVAQQLAPPPPPPLPVTPVEDPRPALVQRMARLASQTDGQMPLPPLPVSRPQSPVEIGGEWEEGRAVSTGGQPLPSAAAPKARAEQQQMGGGTMQEQLSNGHHAHDAGHSMQPAPPPQQQQQQQQQHVSGPPPHAYMPSTPTPMPVHPQIHSGHSGFSHGHGGGQQAPSSAWGATPPSGMHHAAQQQPTHHEQQQQQTMSSPLLSGMGGPGVGYWPGHASPGLMYGAPVQHVPMAMPMAAQPPWAAPQLYHHPASPAYSSGPAAMYYAAAQGDALARLHAVTEHLARSVDSMLHRPPAAFPYSLSAPPPATVASLGTSSLGVAPVSPALSTATTRVTRVAAERDAAEAQRRALAAERDAAEDERDAALAQLVELRLHLAHAQEQVQALQREQSSAAETAGNDVAATKAELAAVQRQAAQRAEELRALVQAHRGAEQAWQRERGELEATCGAWERTAQELQARCEALRRELAEKEARREAVAPVAGEATIEPPPQAEPAARVSPEVARSPQVAEVEPEEAPAAEATEPAVANSEGSPGDIEGPPIAEVPAAAEEPPHAALDEALVSAPAEEAVTVAAEAAEAADPARAASPEPAWEDASETPTAQVAASPVSDAAQEVAAPEVQETAAVVAALPMESIAGETQPSDATVPPIPAAGGPKPTQRPRGAGGRRLPSTAPPPPPSQPAQQPAQVVPAVSTGTAAAAAKPSRRKTIFDESDDDGGGDDVAPPPRPAMPPPPPRPAEPVDDDDGW
jgi:hypothetical protein